ncbi:MAG TPA: MarR family transcriptional regulator [Candidatus Limnocylindria bacterium]
MTTATKADIGTARALLAVMPFFGRLAATTAREHGVVSPERAKALVRLAAGPMRAGELAQQCMLTPPAMTEAVEGLVRDGLVRREDDPSDRRAVRVSLTAAGRREVDRYHAAIAEALGDAIATLEPLARERLRLALEDLRHALERAAQKEMTNVR